MTVLAAEMTTLEIGEALTNATAPLALSPALPVRITPTQNDPPGTAQARSDPGRIVTSGQTSWTC